VKSGGTLYNILLVIIFIAALFPARAVAEVKRLPYNTEIDLAVTAGSAIGWFGMSLAQNMLAPADCRWCQADSFDKWGHDSLKWSDTGSANAAVYVTGYALAPLAVFGLDAFAAHKEGAMDGFWADALIIAEASAAACLFAQIVKVAAGRERPRSYYGGGATNPADNLSFYSGHTTLAFSLAVAGGTTATMRGYELAPWIWGTGLGIAGVTGYLSVASDRHYLTDVIAGAGTGAAFGFGVPYLFHRPKERKFDKLAFSAVPVEGGALLNIGGGW
jgi:membrane-associated phospholipid phosphatase